jgi:hypothetical protein
MFEIIIAWEYGKFKLREQVKHVEIRVADCAQLGSSSSCVNSFVLKLFFRAHFGRAVLLYSGMLTVMVINNMMLIYGSNNVYRIKGDSK